MVPTPNRPDPGIPEKKNWPPPGECPYVEVVRTADGWELRRYRARGAPMVPFRRHARTRWGAQRIAKRWIRETVRRRWRGESFVVEG